MRGRACDDAANTIHETDERGTRMRYDYLGLGVPVRTVDMATSQALHEYGYDAKLRVVTETRLPASGTEGTVTRTTYDELNRVTSRETKNKQGVVLAKESVAYIGAENGLRVERKTIHGDANAPSIVTASYADAAGRAVKIERMLNGQALTDTLTYDYLGRKLTLTDAFTRGKNPSGITAQWEYDALGNAPSIVTASYTDAAGRAVKAERMQSGQALMDTLTYEGLLKKDKTIAGSGNILRNARKSHH